MLEKPFHLNGLRTTVIPHDIATSYVPTKKRIVLGKICTTRRAVRFERT
jgi:hypothetical protein